MELRKAVHPKLERLTAFAQGKLTGAEENQIASHLVGCEQCADVLDGVPEDTLAAALREASTVRDFGAARPESSLPTEAESRPSPIAKPPRCGMTDIPAELVNHPRYDVIGHIGAGGMGTVYKAEHRLMRRPVALKVVSPRLIDNPSAAERFRREVRAAAQLAHPNIVAAYDAEEVSGLHFLVTEYVPGTTLAAWVAEHGPLPVAQACEYMRQAALGLQHAFERGMVHRDIKPQNLMLTPAGVVKILDFGLARFASETSPCEAITDSGAWLGTPDYVAPEQARDPRSADIRADIYSLGCTLYHLLAGQTPFPEGSIVQKLMSHIERAPKPLGELRSDIPPELVKVVARMMAKNPAHRYETPADVAETLTRFVGNFEMPSRRSWRAPKVAAALILAAAVVVLGGIVVYHRIGSVVEHPWTASPETPRDDETQAELTRERKGAAPDLSGLRLLYHDEFDDPASGWLRDSDKDREYGYADGKYYIRALWGPSCWGWSGMYRQFSNFTCEVVGRTTGPPSDGWGLVISQPQSKHQIIVACNSEAQLWVELGRIGLDAGRGSRTVIKHDAIREGDAFNTLLVIVRQRRVELYVNSIAPCDPVTLEWDITPCDVFLFVFARQPGAQVEFERITLRSLE